MKQSIQVTGGIKKTVGFEQESMDPESYRIESRFKELHENPILKDIYGMMKEGRKELSRSINDYHKVYFENRLPISDEISDPDV